MLEFSLTVRMTVAQLLRIGIFVRNLVLLLLLTL